MGIDILLCIILVGVFCICGGFGSYGCYRCCTDKESRVDCEDSLKKRELYKHSRKSRFLSLFRKSGKYSRNSSLSSFTGTIYTVSSRQSSGGGYYYSKEMDGKVPLDLLQDSQSQDKTPNNNNPNRIVENWTLQNEVEDKPKKGILKTGEATRAKTAPN